jgi:hypothetical protein
MKYTTEINNYKLKLDKIDEKPIKENIFFSNSSQNLTNSKLSILEVSENTIVESKEDTKLNEDTIDINQNNEEVEEPENDVIEEKDDVFEVKEFLKTKSLIDNDSILNNTNIDLNETEIKDNKNDNYERLVDTIEAITLDSDNKDVQLDNSFENLKESNNSINISSYSTSSSSPPTISPMILQKQQQFKYQQNNMTSSRKLTKFKGRYMTDPLSAQQKDRIQENENSYKLPKRNSLNDRFESQISSSSPTSPNNQHDLLLQNESTNKVLTKPTHGDSTSTLMSTDSGVSSTTYSGHQSTSIESISIVPEYKLSEEECDEIYEDFIKTGNELLLKKSTPVNENSSLLFDNSQHVEIERKMVFISNRNEYGDLNQDCDHSKPNFNSHHSPTRTQQVKQISIHDKKSPKWQTSYQDKDSLPIPLVIGQLNFQNDVNNNNLTNKLSPQVFNSFSLSSTSNDANNTNTFTKKFNHKFKYDGATLNKLKNNKTSLSSFSTQNLNNRHHQSNENINNSEIITSASNLNRSYNKQISLNYINNYNKKIEMENEENEIQLITSQKPSIVRLSSSRGIANNSFEKRCQTPVDYVYIQQYENNNNNKSNYNMDIYDTTIKSGNNTPGNPFRFNNNQQQQQQQQSHSMFFNLLHTTPDAT